VSKFELPVAFEPTEADWELLPFRFHRFPSDRVLLTNMVGEHLFVDSEDLAAIVEKRLPANSSLVRRLRSKHLLRRPGEQLPLELLALKTRTRYSREGQTNCSRYCGYGGGPAFMVEA